MFRLVRGVFTTNQQLSDEGGFVFNWAAENYLDASLMVIRRELDVQSGTENLRNLLEDIIEHTGVLSRARYRMQWTTDKDQADSAFDAFDPLREAGAPEHDQFNPVVVQADLDHVVASAERLRTYAERTRAHRTPERGIDRTITFRDLHNSIGDIRRVVAKYYALLTLYSVAEWEPSAGYDTLAAFTRPWVVDRRAAEAQANPDE
jgi:hypothetical protein